MNRRIPVLALLLLLIISSGCSVNTELGGVRIPNARPETHITGQPPTLLEAGFSVGFHWTGSDDDGKVKGYQWKISDNGTDGISARDTLTFDPLTGAELHPWHFTTATDSVFFVLADQAGFAGDSELPESAANNRRSFRTHTLFVRAMDENDAVDPSPAMISFTSTTLVPTIRVDFPSLQPSLTEPKSAPRTVNVGWIGTDEDFDLRVPTQVRYLWKPAELADGTLIEGKRDYDNNVDELISFDDPEWGEWIPYDGGDGLRRAQFLDRDVNALYLFAVQAQDTAGAVSVGRKYQTNVAHFKISSQFRPRTVLVEDTLGELTGTYKASSIAAGRPLVFSWSADGLAYNGKIQSMRHGWDIIDAGNTDDPGWSVQAGLAAQNRFSTETSFQTGLHVFTLKVVDDSQNEIIVRWNLEVIPYVDYTRQRNMMFLDQYPDASRNTWLNPYNGIAYGDEFYRNDYWSFLHTADAGNSGPPGTVFEFFEDRDWRDHTNPNVDYADIVRYKAVLCIAYSQSEQNIFRNYFRPRNHKDGFVWFSPYQARGGNLFLVGERSMESFLEGMAYMVPIIFDTREFRKVLDGETYYIGFGTKEKQDGTEVVRGPLQYAYATAGISALDWMAPDSYHSYDRAVTADIDRKPGCVGLKGLVLDPAFKSNHLIGPGVIADTMITDPLIDYYDNTYPMDNRWLNVPQFNQFAYDEFYNANISTRNTSMSPQTGCVDGVNGECIEPMFRSLARMDWLREQKRAAGYDDWPQVMPDRNGDLVDWALGVRDTCGEFALNSYEGMANASAKTNNQIIGFLSYKMTESKPSRKADAYWGFDPTRFDKVETKKAVRWVLQYFGLQINN